MKKRGAHNGAGKLANNDSASGPIKAKVLLGGGVQEIDSSTRGVEHGRFVPTYYDVCTYSSLYADI